MKHKFSEVIKAFVDGIECEYWSRDFTRWIDINELTTFTFDWVEKVRIKPEPQEETNDTDIVNYMEVGRCSVNSRFVPDERYLPARWTFKQYANLILTWDGETGILKSAEVIK